MYTLVISACLMLLYYQNVWSNSMDWSSNELMKCDPPEVDIKDTISLAVSNS